MVPLRIKKDTHEVRETDIARYLRRVLGDPDIFTYYHRRRKTLVVCTWVLKSGGLALESVAINENDCPEVIREKVDGVVESRSPRELDFAREMAQTIRESNRAEAHQLQDEHDRYVDMKEWLRTKRCAGHYEDHPGWLAL